jgi:hypothetical protein
MDDATDGHSVHGRLQKRNNKCPRWLKSSVASEVQIPDLN